MFEVFCLYLGFKNNNLMKNKYLSLAFFSFLLLSCNNDDNIKEQENSELKFLEADNTDQMGITSTLTNPVKIKQLDSLVYYEYTNWKPEYKMNFISEEYNYGCSKVKRIYYYNADDLVERIDQIHYRSGNPNTHFGNPNGFYKQATIFLYENGKITKEFNSEIREVGDEVPIDFDSYHVSYIYEGDNLVKKVNSHEGRDEQYTYFSNYFTVHALPAKKGNGIGAKETPEDLNLDIYVDIYQDQFKNHIKYDLGTKVYDHQNIKNIFNPIGNMFPDNFLINYFDFSQINSTHFSSGIYYPTTVFTRKQFIVDTDMYPKTVQEGSFSRGSQYLYYYKN